MARVHTVKKARKEFRAAGIKKGDTYYWWKFRFGGIVRSKSYPRRSQLTQSSFLQTYYDLEEWKFDRDDLQSSIDELKSEVESLRDECQSSLDNMPDTLQESSESGILLQERIDALESWSDELDGFDLSFLDDDLEDGEREQSIDNAISELEAFAPGL